MTTILARTGFANQATKCSNGNRHLLRLLLPPIDHCVRYSPAEHLRSTMLHKHQLCLDAVLPLGHRNHVVHHSQFAEVSASGESFCSWAIALVS